MTPGKHQTTSSKMYQPACQCMMNFRAVMRVMCIFRLMTKKELLKPQSSSRKWTWICPKKPICMEFLPSLMLYHKSCEICILLHNKTKHFPQNLDKCPAPGKHAKFTPWLCMTHSSYHPPWDIHASTCLRSTSPNNLVFKNKNWNLTNLWPVNQPFLVIIEIITCHFSPIMYFSRLLHNHNLNWQWLWNISWINCDNFTKL